MTKLRSLYLDHFTLRKTHLYELHYRDREKNKVADLFNIGNTNKLYYILSDY